MCVTIGLTHASTKLETCYLYHTVGWHRGKYLTGEMPADVTEVVRTRES